MVQSTQHSGLAARRENTQNVESFLVGGYGGLFRPVAVTIGSARRARVSLDAGRVRIARCRQATPAAIWLRTGATESAQSCSNLAVVGIAADHSVAENCAAETSRTKTTPS